MRGENIENMKTWILLYMIIQMGTARPPAQFPGLCDAGGVRRRLFGCGSGFGGACAFAKQDRNS